MRLVSWRHKSPCQLWYRIFSFFRFLCDATFMAAGTMVISCSLFDANFKIDRHIKAYYNFLLFWVNTSRTLYFRYTYFQIFFYRTFFPSNCHFLYSCVEHVILFTLTNDLSSLVSNWLRFPNFPNYKIMRLIVGRYRIYIVYSDFVLWHISRHKNLLYLRIILEHEETRIVAFATSYFWFFAVYFMCFIWMARLTVVKQSRMWFYM